MLHIHGIRKITDELKRTLGDIIKDFVPMYYTQCCFGNNQNYFSYQNTKCNKKHSMVDL